MWSRLSGRNSLSRRRQCGVLGARRSAAGAPHTWQRTPTPPRAAGRLPHFIGRRAGYWGRPCRSGLPGPCTGSVPGPRCRSQRRRQTVRGGQGLSISTQHCPGLEFRSGASSRPGRAEPRWPAAAAAGGKSQEITERCFFPFHDCAAGLWLRGAVIAHRWLQARPAHCILRPSGENEF